MANKTWNVTTGEWSTNADWTPTGAPANSDAAILSNSGTLIVGTTDFAAAAQTLSISDGAMTVDGELTLDGLSVTGSGSLTVDGGGLNDGSGGQGGTVFAQSGNITVTNSGSLVVGLYLTGAVSGTVTLLAGGAYDFQDSQASSTSGNIVDFAGVNGGAFESQVAWGGTIKDFNSSTSNSLSFGAQINSFSYSTSTKTLTVNTASRTFTEKFADPSSVLVSASFTDVGNPYAITFSGAAFQPISTATYDAATGALKVTGAGFTTSANDYNATGLTITGEDSVTYTLTGGSTVAANPTATSFTVNLSAADQLAVDGLLNANGTTTTDVPFGGSFTYALSATANFDNTGVASTNVPITTSNALVPTITSVAYDSSTSVFTLIGAGLDNEGTTYGLSPTMFTIKGQGNVNYTLTLVDAFASSFTSASFQLTGADLTNVNSLLDKAGTSSLDHTAYGFSAVAGWDSDLGAAITNKAITVSSGSAPPAISSAAYNAGTGALVLTGSNLTTSPGDFSPSALTFTGQAGAGFTLTGGTVSANSATGFTVVLTTDDQLAVDGLLNKNGAAAADGTTYNILAVPSFDTGGSASSGGITVGSAATPTISTVAYNEVTGVLSLTGTGLENEGAAGGLSLADFTLTGKGGSGSAVTLSGTASVTSMAAASITLSSGQKNSLNAIFDANGASDGSATYNLAVTAGWDAGVGVAITAMPVTVSGVPLIIVSEAASPTNGDLNAGKVVTFTLGASEAVTATGSSLTLSNGATVAFNAASSTSTSLAYIYTVASGDANTSDLTATALNGAIKDGAGNALVDSGFTTIDTHDIVDTIAPTIALTVASPPNADLNAGKVVTFTLGASEAVTATGSSLTLSNGATVAFNAASSTSTSLAYIYTVASSDTNTSDLTATALNGTITDGAGNALVDSGFTMIDTHDIVDTIAPTVTSLTAATSNGTDLDAGQSVTFTLETSEAVLATGASLTLNNGATAVYASGSGSSAVTFAYTVASGQDIADLQVSGASGVTDLADNALAGPVTQDTGLMIDTTAPTATSIDTSGGNPTNANSDVFTITFSEAVTGLTASDFTVAATTSPGGAAVTSSGITSITGSGTTYTVKLGGVTGDGTLGLNLNAGSPDITDTAGNFDTAAFTGQTFTVEHTPVNVTVADFTANQATLDQWLPGIVIEDSAADVVPVFNLLNSDSHIIAITLTDPGTPTPTLTVAEALNNATALHEITNSPIKIDIADTAANLEALTPAQITQLAALGVTSVVSTDASVYFNWAQSAALHANGVLPIAPAGDIAHEGFSDNTALSWLFGNDGTINNLLTRASDNSFDVHHYEAAGVFHGVIYASSDINFSPTGVRDGATYYGAGGGVVATATFSANGGFTLTIPGEPIKSEIVNADGSYEYGYVGVTGESYSSDQSDFASSNVLVAHSQDFVGGGSGRVNILGDNLIVAAASGTIGPSTATEDFTFAPHASELFALQTGAANDVIKFGSTGFGANVIMNFGLPGAATDSLDLSALFTGYSDLVSHTASLGSNLVITDHASDTITLVGVQQSALTARRTGF